MLSGAVQFICRCPDGRVKRISNYGPAPDAAVPADLCDTACAAKHHELKAADLDGKKASEAFVKHVIEDPKVRAWIECLSFQHHEFQSLFDGLFPTPPSGYDPAIKGHTWPVVLDEKKLCRDIACVAGFWHYEPPKDNTARWDSFSQTAQAIVHAHNAFFDVLRGSDWNAEGWVENFEPKSIPTDKLIRSDYCLDVKEGDLLEAGSRRRIFRGITLRSRAAPPIGRTKKRQRSKYEKVAAVLEKHGLAKDRQGKSDTAIAHVIASDLGSTTALQIDALRKVIERYYKSLR
jgi:hypothetical protein